MENEYDSPALRFTCGCVLVWEKVSESLLYPENHQLYGWVPEEMCKSHKPVYYGSKEVIIA